LHSPILGYPVGINHNVAFHGSGKYYVGPVGAVSQYLVRPTAGGHGCVSGQAGGRLCRLSRHVDCRPTVDIGLHTAGLVYGTLLSS